MAAVPEVYRAPDIAARIALIAASFERLLGRNLVPVSDDVTAALWHLPAAIVAHGTEPDPLFFFANRAALVRFEAGLDSFIGMPSRLSAEAPLRDERQALLDRVSMRGFIDDYSGVRITATGERFRIAGAVVWNLIDERGGVQGQAATFAV
jgi:hypothetical protein